MQSTMYMFCISYTDIIISYIDIIISYVNINI